MEGLKQSFGMAQSQTGGRTRKRRRGRKCRGGDNSTLLQAAVAQAVGRRRRRGSRKSRRGSRKHTRRHRR